jgi:hypothetical protein
VPRVRVDPDDARDRALDPRFLERLTDGCLGDRLAEVDGPARYRPVPVVGPSDHQDRPFVVHRDHVDEGTRLFAAGASGSS